MIKNNKDVNFMNSNLEIPHEALQVLRAGQLIEAIKITRKTTGQG